jgi:hypothetical protein
MGRPVNSAEKAWRAQGKSVLEAKIGHRVVCTKILVITLDDDIAHRNAMQ